MNEEKSVFNILDELESTAGSNAKKEILFKNRHNELLKKVFVAACDPYTVYYVNKFKMPVSKDEQSDDNVLDYFCSVVLPPLSSRLMTGNDAKQWVTDAFERMNENQQKWCLRILLKNLRVGVQESTLNKVWPGLVKSFAVALATTVKSEFVKGEGIRILDNVEYPVRCEPKLDGLRCIAVKQDGVVTFYTRNGTVIEHLDGIRTTLENIDYDNVVFDGEMMGRDWSESASVLMSSKNLKDDSHIVYNVFDGMLLKDWVEQTPHMTYGARTEFVRIVLSDIKATNIKQVDHVVVNSEAELKNFFSKCMDEGFEGIMLKTMDSYYEFKRSDNIRKLKPCVTYEGVIVSCYDGRRGTKREGTFGGMEILLPNGVITRLGSGFNDAIRADVQLEGYDAYVGRIVEIEAQPDPLTADGLSVDGKARFPVFCRFRSPADVDSKVVDAYDAYVKGSR